ncbi:AraC family transcriptional regulator [Salmonella enterica subsp. enterica serovar Java]|uniref:AraC family transcriptional regulator n=3 Tax=Salmonella enterica TaxID=28901 RepID=A0A3R0U5U4_SALER|nr:AraC family transcriptional regulator [Salmonella enterica subsp. enterica serovar Java]EAO1480254.1 AraC family transcriptional regulator [Salmonella enterica]EBZ6267851.1 AraC family transcriptional regulator [Salmonella enterica subsp. enterica serovar Oranienburg]EBR8574831.1 AraC family transcriptional regulator [Salmonella enterica subsp. enterica serovar Java]ECA1474299.1 AraC family transcriptional regulator [Salmonella enterica subsp. enterica serovar Oranienburg]
MSKHCSKNGDENTVIRLDLGGEATLFTLCDQYLLLAMQTPGPKILLIHAGEAHLSNASHAHRVESGHCVVCDTADIFQSSLDCCGILFRSELFDNMCETSMDVCVLPSSLRILLRELFHDRSCSGLKPSRFYLRAKCHELLVQLIEWHLRSPMTHKCSSHDIDCVEKVMNIIKQHLADPPGLSELSRRVGINETKLKRLFREHYGSPVFVCLKELRLQQARHLIQSSDLPLREIVSLIGMRSGGYFAQAYRQRFGVLPHETRE